MPWTPKPISQLERQIETLQIKLLRANSELRLKTVYAQRLEFLLQHRMATIDELVAKLDQARAQNKRLEAGRRSLGRTDRSASTDRRDNV